MRSLVVLAGFAAAFVTLPDAAQACSPLPNYRPPSQAELNRSTIERFRRAAAVVEVVADTASTFERPGRMRVLRIYKGNVRPGTRLTVRSVPGSMCGHGDFPAGARGIIMIHRLDAPPTFQGFISTAHVALLRREGLLPRR